MSWAPKAPKYLPETFSVLVEGDKLPYGVNLQFRVTDGEPVLQALTVTRSVRRHRWFSSEDPEKFTPRYETDSKELSSFELRRIPVARLRQLAILTARHNSASRKGRRAAYEPPSLDEWANLYSQVGVVSRLGRAFLDDDHYRMVAEIYSDAFKKGLNPTEQVKNHFYKELSTAAHYVAEARRRDFLGKTTRGKKGAIEPAKPGKSRKAKTNRKKLVSKTATTPTKSTRRR